MPPWWAAGSVAGVGGAADRAAGTDLFHGRAGGERGGPPVARPTSTLPPDRYYTAAQLARLNRAIALKDLGFTLQQVQEILDERSQPKNCAPCSGCDEPNWRLQ